MLKLMKYEMRKALTARMILLIGIAAMEAYFLWGLLFHHDERMILGGILLFFVASFGIFFLGIQGITTLHRDLNSKQSYMLFLTPRTSSQILGAKLLENALAIVTVSLIAFAIGFLDFQLAIRQYGNMAALISMINKVMSIRLDINISTLDIILAASTTVVSWLMTVVTGYLAVILTATVLAGRKFSSLIALVIYIVLMYFYSRIMEMLPGFESRQTGLIVDVVVTLIIAVIMYIISSLIMEKKLSV